MSVLCAVGNRGEMAHLGLGKYEGYKTWFHRNTISGIMKHVNGKVCFGLKRKLPRNSSGLSVGKSKEGRYFPGEGW